MHRRQDRGRGRHRLQARNWDVPAEEKRILLHKLRQMNITAASLFPGIDALGRSIAELVDLGMTHW